MKVLHLCAGNLYGGVETLLVTLARCRDVCPEMDPHFGLCFPGRLRDELTATGVPVHDLGAVRVSRPWTVLRARWRLKWLLKSEKFDAAVAHSSWPHALFAPVVRAARVRLAHALHGQIDRCHWLNRWAARTRPDVVLANSRFIADDAKGWFPGVPATVVYPPVVGRQQHRGEQTRGAIRREFRTATDAVVLLTVSRIEELKGHAVLCDALARLADLPGWVWWVVGGAQRPSEVKLLHRIHEKIRADRLGDRVRLLGQRTDVLAVLSAADVYAQPNTGPEGFGIAFIEALDTGLPVVTSNFGGGAEVVDDTCGLLTPPGDAAAVAAALAELIRDADRRATLGNRGPDRARQLCDPARQLNRLAAALSSCPGDGC